MDLSNEHHLHEAKHSSSSCNGTSASGDIFVTNIMESYGKSISYNISSPLAVIANFGVAM